MSDKPQARFAFPKLVVRDLQRQAAFYRTVMGYGEGSTFSATFKDRPMSEVIFSNADGDVDLVLLAYDDDGAAPDPGGVVAGFFTSDLDALDARVLAAGGAVMKPIKSFKMGDRPARLAFYTDPEGYVIEVIEK